MTTTAIVVFVCFLLTLVHSSSGWSRELAGEKSGRSSVRRHATLKSPTEHQRDGGVDDATNVPPLVSGLLKISYDGAHFSGWSAANQQHTSSTSAARFSDRRLSGRNKRRARGYGIAYSGTGQVRSVEHVLQMNLAKLFRNVDPSQIVVDGCSRTDKGVHAQCMVAQFYCLSTDHKETSSHVSSSMTIPGKRKPHPQSSHDSSASFLSISMDLPKIMYCLNRMLPHDVKVRAVAHVPERNVASSTSATPFHPTLDSVAKTYQYSFSVGAVHDPLCWRTTWHLESDEGFCINDVQRVAEELLTCGTRNFAAFRGAPRGKDDKRRQAQESTACTLHDITIIEAVPETSISGLSTLMTTFTVTVTGDRFLYKMMRFLVGALVAVGTKKLMYDDIQRALETGSWERNDGSGERPQFTCAPAHGLILANVTYDQDIVWMTSTNRRSTYA